MAGATSVDVSGSGPPTEGPVGDDVVLEVLADRLHARGPERYERLGKVVIDRLFAAVALLLVSPLLLIVTVLVSVGRPILYRQLRAGRCGTC